MRSPEHRAHLPALADPRARPRLSARGCLGAADARSGRRVPAPRRGVRRGRSGADPARAARALWSLRWKLGELFGLDDPGSGLGSRVRTLRERVPEDLRAAAGPEFESLPFTSLYLTDDEFAAEIANQTMHGILHLGWVAEGAAATGARWRST